jgi:ATP-binding cassette subfamily C (CFTR/MRP) protein 1
VENLMVSVERLYEYARLPAEQAPLSDSPGRQHACTTPPSDWPSSGAFEFRNLSLRYSESAGSKALTDISFSVRDKEKIGLLGVDATRLLVTE